MRKSKRLTFLFLIATIGILSGFVLLETPYHLRLKYEYLILLSIFLMGIPSFIFNIQLYRFISMIQEISPLDYDLIEKRKFKKQFTLQISYFLFGILIVSYGIIVFLRLQNELFPLKYTEYWEVYTTLFAILVIGVSIIIDVIFILLKSIELLKL